VRVPLLCWWGIPGDGVVPYCCLFGKQIDDLYMKSLKNVFTPWPNNSSFKKSVLKTKLEDLLKIYGQRYS